MPPTFIQRLFLAILPQSWAESMVADSKAWHAHCPCGHARSIWDLGGIRWKANRNSKKLIRCPECSQITWHSIRRVGNPACPISAAEPSIPESMERAGDLPISDRS